MEWRAASRVAEFGESVFSEVLRDKQAAVKAGRDVIDLSIGSPDLPPAPHVVEALAKAVAQPCNYGYAVRQTEAFTEAVRWFYQHRYGVALEADEVLQVMGSQEGLAHLALAVINPGDVVLVPDPGYPIYEASVRLAGGTVHPLPLLEENGFVPDLSAIPQSVLERTRMMVLNYPGNPVTRLAPEGFFRDVVQLAQRYGFLVVHDFAYSELVFDGLRAQSFLSVPGARDVGVEFNSLSKTFNLAGCRIGYVTGHRGVLRALAQLKSQIDYGIFLAIQEAAAVALRTEDSYYDHLVAVYQARRDALVEALRDIGWTVPSPPATMFVWTCLPEGTDSIALARDLLREAGVAVTPGITFGPRGESHVRLALVQSEDRLRLAAQRIGESGLLQRYRITST